MSMIPAFQSLPMHLVNEIISMVPWEGQRELHIKCMHEVKNKRCMDDINKYRKRMLYYKNKDMRLKKGQWRVRSGPRSLMIITKGWKRMTFKDFVLKIPKSLSPLNEEWNLMRKEGIRQRGYDALFSMGAFWRDEPYSIDRFFRNWR